MSRLDEKGESWLVQHIIDSLPSSELPGEGPGDDAAVVYKATGEPMLFCIDTLVEGIHFRLDISSPKDVGWKAVAVNVSDIAAMGGLPATAVISVSAPPHTSVEVVSELIRGADECARHYDAAIVGGDTGEASQLVVTVACLGTMPEGIKPVLRNGAKPGDKVLVTGCLGAAQLGLETALYKKSSSPELVMAHKRPIPRVKEGMRAARAGATAMIDISDGLVLDASRLAQASGVALAIDLDALPLSRDDNKANSSEALVKTALVGGDDYELLFTFGPEQLDRLLEEWGPELAPISVIGQVEPGSGLRLRPEKLVPEDLGAGGWEHFATSGRP